MTSSHSFLTYADAYVVETVARVVGREEVASTGKL